ncbi:UNVERIFIED_CONTAM: hypothetical protein FKN15_019998 [Acipenser sinensis]
MDKRLLEYKRPTELSTEMVEVSLLLGQRTSAPDRPTDTDAIELLQTDVTPDRRSTVVKWMFEFVDETQGFGNVEHKDAGAFHAVVLLDRYLSLVKTEKTELQKIAAACLIVAFRVRTPVSPSDLMMGFLFGDKKAADSYVSRVCDGLQMDLTVETHCDYYHAILPRFSLRSDQERELVESTNEMLKGCVRKWEFMRRKFSPWATARVALAICAEKLGMGSDAVLDNTLYWDCVRYFRDGSVPSTY